MGKRVLRWQVGDVRISRVHGILNGTCNYILTTMRETGREFDADPTGSGYDPQQIGTAGQMEGAAARVQDALAAPRREQMRNPIDREIHGG